MGIERRYSNTLWLCVFGLIFKIITAMFLAVPIMAAVKYYLVSAQMPSVYLNPLLTMLEGDAHGPHKNFVDRHRVEMSAREDCTTDEMLELSEPGDTDLDF